MLVYILGTSWDQCRSMVQYSFTSTKTRSLVRTATSTLTQLLNYDVRGTSDYYLVLLRLHSPLIYDNGATARTALSSEICAGCPRHFKLLFCVTSNFWSGPNSKSTKRILTRFKMPKGVDHYLFIYQKLSLLPNLPNEARIRLTPRTQPWNRISSN